MRGKNVVASFFPLIIFIYSALLQHIEHCSTRKSTYRLPIYIYIYIYMIKRSLNLKLNMTVSARSYE